MDVGFGDVGRVEGGGVVVEDAEEVVIVANGVAITVAVGRVRFGDVRS